MKSRLWFAIIAFGVVICLLITLRNGGADESTNQEPSPFAGKCLTISSKDLKVANCLEDCQVVKLNGRDFIVGKSLAPTEAWAPLAGKTVWVPVDG